MNMPFKEILTKNGGQYLTCENNTWSAHRLSAQIGCKFAQNNIQVINQTWVNNVDWSLINIIKQWQEKSTKNRVIFFSAFDPPFQDLASFKKTLQSFGNQIDLSRITYVSSKDFCFWLLAVDNFFLKYPAEAVTPNTFKHKFLCYQRKPNYMRQLLYDSLRNKPGIITIGTQEFPDINNSIPDHSGHNEIGGQLAVSNDIWSLGNIDIWNSSFLNIVSETKQLTDVAAPFVSEKIFKPMIGLRPFICFGHPKTSVLLKTMGFETFDDDFDYRATEQVFDILQISNIVDNIDVSVYNSLMPKMIHNKNWIPQAAQKEWQKIDELVKELCYE